MLTLITVPNVEIIHLPFGDPAPKTKYEPLHKRKQHYITVKILNH